MTFETDKPTAATEATNACMELADGDSPCPLPIKKVVAMLDAAQAVSTSLLGETGPLSAPASAPSRMPASGPAIDSPVQRLQLAFAAHADCRAPSLPDLSAQTVQDVEEVLQRVLTLKQRNPIFSKLSVGPAVAALHVTAKVGGML